VMYIEDACGELWSRCRAIVNAVDCTVNQQFIVQFIVQSITFIIPSSFVGSLKIFYNLINARIIEYIKLSLFVCIY